MMIAIDWGDVNETFLVMSIKGSWTSKELIEIVAKTNDLVSSKPYPVHLLVDAHDAGNLPVDAMRLIPTLVRQRPSNSGETIIITQNNIWQNMWNILQPAIRYLNKNDLRFVTNANDAYDLLRADTAATDASD
jgi:hypothetical protein